MCPRIFATFVALLTAAGAALGQYVPQVPQAPPPVLETLPQPAPFAGAPPDLAAPPIVPGGVPDVGPPAGWMPRIDADLVLWFSPTARNPTFIDQFTLAGTAFTGGGDTLADENLSKHIIPGARVAVGYWWMEENAWTPGRLLPMAGFETRFMIVGERSFALNDAHAPTLVRPFFDINDATLNALIIAAPGIATGSLSTRAAQNLWGVEANYWRNLYYEWPGTTCSVDGMIGLRYLNFDGQGSINTDTQFVAAPPAAYAALAGNRLVQSESFNARNQFYGGQLGARANLIFDRFIVSGQFQLGIGGTSEEILIQGSTVRTLPGGGTIVSPGALYALPSNIGAHYHNEFTLIPEFGATLTIPVNANLSFGVTFTTLYWSRLIRAADQIDTAVNVAQIPAGAFVVPPAVPLPTVNGNHPGVQFNQSDLWIMGAMLTATFRW
jgi:hypothetical protein